MEPCLRLAKVAWSQWWGFSADILCCDSEALPDLTIKHRLGMEALFLPLWYTTIPRVFVMDLEQLSCSCAPQLCG